MDHDGLWRFVGKPEHRIWGWLQISEIIKLGEGGSGVVTERPWLSDHPHTRPGWSTKNTLYVASENLTLGSRALSIRGYGALEKGHRLSGARDKVSTWRVPDWLNPKQGGSGMTYHPSHCWSDDGTVQSAARGQEFVAQPRDIDEVTEWLTALMEDNLT